jgi:hypothetical protein
MHLEASAVSTRDEYLPYHVMLVRKASDTSIRLRMVGIKCLLIFEKLGLHQCKSG